MISWNQPEEMEQDFGMNPSVDQAQFRLLMVKPAIIPTG